MMGKGVEGSGCALISGTTAYVCLEGLKKKTENPSQDSRSSGQVFCVLNIFADTVYAFSIKI
jgi:hypothetical protein